MHRLRGNDFDHYSYPNALVSCWGAIGDLNWINQNNTIPLVMFHGSSDAVVPFNSGFPFTIDLFLPLVHGSNLINERLNILNIQNEFYGEPNLPHEYWGTSNGMWSDGPNEYFNIIKEDAYSFLFDVLYPFQLGDANNDGLINLLDISHVTSAIIFNNSYSIDPYYYDLNFDSEINIFDIIILADNILDLQ